MPESKDLSQHRSFNSSFSEWYLWVVQGQTSDQETRCTEVVSPLGNLCAASTVGLAGVWSQWHWTAEFSVTGVSYFAHVSVAALQWTKVTQLSKFSLNDYFLTKTEGRKGSLKYMEKWDTKGRID